MMLKSFFALSTGLVGGAHAFWRMECPGRVGLARIDPIINPGDISKHAHSIHGSSGFGQITDTEQLLDADCTSCRVTQDKSSYWHPALYFQDDDTGKYELVPQVGGMLAYYLLFGDNVTAFPPDFRMMSGTDERRRYTIGDPSKPDPEKSTWHSLGQTKQSDLAQRALGFNCLNYQKQPEGTLYRHYMPDKEYLDANCKDGIRLEIMFPSCWKGGDAVDSDNHKDHVAFPDLVMTGTCPQGYPVRLPSLMYEVIWNTAAFEDRNGHFVFANGDITGNYKLMSWDILSLILETGYSYHADFITGWEEEFLQDAIKTCTSDTGRIQDCPLFDVVSEAEATSCKIKLPDVLADEDIEGPMKELPGGGEASHEDGSDESDDDDDDKKPASSGGATAPTLTYSPGDRPKNSASPLPGQVFKQTSAYGAPAPGPSSETTTAPLDVPASTPTDEPALIPGIKPADDGYVGGLAIEEPEVPEAPEVSTSVAEPTTTPAPESVPPPDTKSYYSTQYVTNGNLVSKILWEEELVYVTDIEEKVVVVTVTSTAVATPSVVPYPPRRRRRGAHLHGHGHRHF
ncbi:hypothetical protein F66182_6591 [Fusarium sp. NRRL 66182]|nr:hypothetical protein F66182_6591 [Fusarium sp. NRRL 66182]